MKKIRSNGVLVYGILFIAAGLLAVLPICQTLLLYNMSEEKVKAHFARQMQVQTKTSADNNLPDNLTLEGFVERQYQIHLKLKEQEFFSPLLYLSLLIYSVVIVLGIGLLKLKPWAYKLTSLIAITAIAQLFIGYDFYVKKTLPIMEASFQDVPFSNFALTAIKWGTIIFSCGYFIVFSSVIYFLSRPAVKEQFIKTEEVE